MEIALLNEKVDQLATMRKSKDALKERLDMITAEFNNSVKSLVDEIKQSEADITTAQEEILQTLRDSDTKTWKTDKATITRKSTVSYKVVDESKVIEQLKKLNLANEYVKETIIPQTKALFEKQAFEGVEKQEKEFVSVIIK
jgi:hypothetical protein